MIAYLNLCYDSPNPTCLVALTNQKYCFVVCRLIVDGEENLERCPEEGIAVEKMIAVLNTCKSY
jgi:hypothetical protein